MLKIQDNDKTYFNKIHSFLKTQNIKLIPFKNDTNSFFLKENI